MTGISAKSSRSRKSTGSRKPKDSREVLESVAYKDGDIGNSASRGTETGVFLGQVNYYLAELGLGLLPKDFDSLAFKELSYLGDLWVKQDVFPYALGEVAGYCNTNENMKLALVRLGWHEFISAPPHYGGTVFETLYAIAHVQGSLEVKNDLLEALVGKLEVRRILVSRDSFIYGKG